MKGRFVKKTEKQKYVEGLKGRLVKKKTKPRYYPKVDSRNLA